VIDPRTGYPSTSSTVAVTCVAREAWWAEVTATSALLADDPLIAPGVRSVLAVAADGDVRASGALERLLACSPA
jgi:thiamine biosynthesis lipoprotein ApbE